MDEADLFAPQNPQKGDEVMLGHMDNIVRRGHVKGFIPWLISQRPAVLNKNVLSQVDGLPAFKLAFVTFHIFRHTWATWMRMYGGADQLGLKGTNNWKDLRSVARYAHVVPRYWPRPVP